MIVTVAKFREQIDFLGSSCRDLAACVGADEKARAVESIRRRASDLRAMECPRGKDDDFRRASEYVARADAMIARGSY